jgi:hypothetical protein
MAMRLRRWGFAGIVTGLLVVAGAKPAAAQDREFAFGVGYGHLFWDGSHTGPLEEQGGLVLDGRLTWAVTPDAGPGRTELRVGFGLDLAFYVSQDNDGDVEVINGIAFITGSDYTALSVIAPQVELSLRQPVFDEHWYIEPGIAGVFMIGNYTTGQDFFWFVDQDVNDWRVGGGGKAFLRFAYTKDRWSIGAEGSYGYGWLDFGHDIGGDIQQAYFGVFYAQRF